MSVDTDRKRVSKVKIEVEINDKLETLIANYRERASKRSKENQDRAATLDSTIKHFIEFAANEELRRFDKSDESTTKAAISAATKLYNEALESAIKAKNFDKLNKLVEAGLEAFMK
jgi:cell fate regulator YaaT (PSP1 superfamily)